MVAEIGEEKSRHPPQIAPEDDDRQGEKDIVEDAVSGSFGQRETQEPGQPREERVRRKGQNDEVEGKENAAQRPFQIVHGG